MFYWPTHGLHKQQAFLLDGERRLQFRETKANRVIAELVWDASSFLPTASTRKVPTPGTEYPAVWPWANHFLSAPQDPSCKTQG